MRCGTVPEGQSSRAHLYKLRLCAVATQRKSLFARERIQKHKPLIRLQAECTYRIRLLDEYKPNRLSAKPNEKKEPSSILPFFVRSIRTH